MCLQSVRLRIAKIDLVPLSDVRMHLWLFRKFSHHGDAVWYGSPVPSTADFVIDLFTGCSIYLSNNNDETPAENKTSDEGFFYYYFVE